MEKIVVKDDLYYYLLKKSNLLEDVFIEYYNSIKLGYILAILDKERGV